MLIFFIKFKKLKRFFATKLSTSPNRLSIMSSQTETYQQQTQFIEEDYSNMPQLEAPYQIPAKPYYLSQTVRPLEEICRVTNNFTYMSEDFKRTLFFRIGNRQWPTTFGMFKSPSDVDALKKIIGIDGYFLKLTTQNCDVDIIWHDRQNNMFVFWGPCIYAVVQAMNQIRSRIIKYTVYVNPAQERIQALSRHYNRQHAVQQTSVSRQDGIEDISDDEDDDDVPDLIDCDGNIVN
jgi:hypothetical protein